MIIRIFSILFFISIFYIETSAQSVTDVRKQKEKSEKEIVYLNKLLNDASKDKTVSTQKLNILQEKIRKSKELLNSLNQEVNYLQRDILTNEKRIDELTNERKVMLDLYAKLVYASWKKRNKANKLMFIFSSSDFNQAYNRFKYFQQIQEYSSRQLELIHQVNDSLGGRNQHLKNLVEQKNVILNSINDKNRDLESEKMKENQYVSELQKKEKNLKRKLQEEVKNQERLAKELNKLMTRLANKTKSSSGYKLTPEEKLISDDFAKNRGKLPWPVAEGFISRKFGLNVNPVHKKVTVYNYGVDITTSKSTDARSVFDGVVSDVLFIPGSNNVVMILHGSYVTIYTNLVDLSVKKGDRVKTKQTIGKVAYDSDEGSVLNFQMWFNTGKGSPENLNPGLWLAK